MDVVPGQDGVQVVQQDNQVGVPPSREARKIHIYILSLSSIACGILAIVTALAQA